MTEQSNDKKETTNQEKENSYFEPFGADQQVGLGIDYTQKVMGVGLQGTHGLAFTALRTTLVVPSTVYEFGINVQDVREKQGEANAYNVAAVKTAGGTASFYAGSILGEAVVGLAGGGPGGAAIGGFIGAAAAAYGYYNPKCFYGDRTANQVLGDAAEIHFEKADRDTEDSTKTNPYNKIQKDSNTNADHASPNYNLRSKQDSTQSQPFTEQIKANGYKFGSSSTDNCGSTPCSGNSEASSSTSNPYTFTREHNVNKGETLFTISRNYKLKEDDILKTPGNEYLNQHKYRGDFGREYVKIQPSYKIHIPSGAKYEPKAWSKDSNYPASMPNLDKHFSSLKYFGEGIHKSAATLGERIGQGFRQYTNEQHSQSPQHVYNMRMQRDKQYKHQDSEKYQDKQDKQGKTYGKESSSGQTGENNSGKSQPFYGSNANIHIGREYKAPETTPLNGASAHFDSAGRVYGSIPILNGNAAAGVYGGRDGGGINLSFKFPLAVDLQNDGMKLTALENSSSFYDIDDNGFLKNLGWPDKEDALLAIDLDNDGVINQAQEIVFKMWDEKAVTDFDGFKLAFDENKDGKVDVRDPKFKDLVVWQDHNQNGVSEGGELTSMMGRGIEAFLLNEETEIKGEKNQGGNQIFKAVKIQATKPIGALYDVMLTTSSAGISYEEEYGQIILHYSDNTSVKIYKVEEEDGEVVDFKDTDYTVALGNKGDDDFKASNKDSVLDGYEGDDILTGGDGHDWLKGGEGTDTLRGGKGHDILLIDSEDKQVNIDGGEDYDIAIVATAAAVILDLAKANIEAAYGNRGNDRFTAKDSNAGVMIDAGDGDDDIEGSDHADNLTGGNGKDKIRAGKGDDHIHIDAEDDLDGIDGGEGIDMLLVYGDKGVTIDAAKLNVESIAGTSGNDVFSNSGDQKVELRGEAGKDRLTGGKGDDILDGGVDDDYMEGGLGSDKYNFYLGAGHETILNHNTDKDIDTVMIASSIRKEDLLFRRVNDDLKLTIRNNNKDSLTIQNWYKEPDETNKQNGVINYKIKNFRVDAELANYKDVTFVDGGENSFRMTDQEVEHIILIADGTNTIGGGNKSDFIVGGIGKDNIHTGKGDDKLTGGPGDGDLSQGGHGNDHYFYYRGDGKDSILDEYKFLEIKEGFEDRVKTETISYNQYECVPRYDSKGNYRESCRNRLKEKRVETAYKVPYTEKNEVISNGVEADLLQFGPGISPSDLIFRKDGDNLLIGLKEEGKSFSELKDTLNIINWFHANSKVEHFYFVDYPSIGISDINFYGYKSFKAGEFPWVGWYLKEDNADSQTKVLAMGYSNGPFSKAVNLGKSFDPENKWINQDQTPAFLADINGDNKSDIVIFASDGVYVAFSTGNAFESVKLLLESFHHTHSWISQDSTPRFLADVNGDSKADIVGFSDKGVYVSFSTGGSFESAKFIFHSFHHAHGWTSQEKTPRFLADVNGDGKADIVGFSAGGVYVAYSNGNSFESPKLLFKGFHSADGWTSQEKTPRFLADVNGDSKADIVGFGTNGVYVASSAGNSFEIARKAFDGFHHAHGWISQDSTPRFLADITDDGKAEVLGFIGDIGYVAFPTGSSFDAVSYLLDDYCPKQVWLNQKQHPRFLADVDGDKKLDIVGFKDGVHVSYGKNISELPELYLAKPNQKEKIAIKNDQGANAISAASIGFGKCKNMILGFNPSEDQIDLSNFAPITKDQITFSTINIGTTKVSVIQQKGQDIYLACCLDFDASTDLLVANESIVFD